MASTQLTSEQINLLAEIPLVLSKSLDTKQIIRDTLRIVRDALSAEAASVFLKDPDAEELTFWAIEGGTSFALEGLRMPAKKGIVGWVIENGKSCLIPDVKKDPRFFSQIDKKSSFVTRDVVCVPLKGRAGTILGALQILNKRSEDLFSETDLSFAERVAPIAALAIENSLLVHDLEERNRVLENLDRRKDETISLIVHEFKTPLNVILTSSDLITGGISSPAALKRLGDTLTNGVMRLSRAISNINMVSNTSHKDFEVARLPFDLSPLIRETVSYFVPSRTKRDLSLKMDLPAEKLLVMGSAVHIQIVLYNLISNAIRFTPDGGSIVVRVFAEAGLASISVTDSGIGISQSQLETIFERFYEVTPILHHSSGEFEFKSSGLGLGLAAARAIVRAHGADLSVSSVPGKGSAFTFRLAIQER